MTSSGCLVIVVVVVAVAVTVAEAVVVAIAVAVAVAVVVVLALRHSQMILGEITSRGLGPGAAGTVKASILY